MWAAHLYELPEVQHRPHCSWNAHVRRDNGTKPVGVRTIEFEYQNIVDSSPSPRQDIEREEAGKKDRQELCGIELHQGRPIRYLFTSGRFEAYGIPVRHSGICGKFRLSSTAPLTFHNPVYQRRNGQTKHQTAPEGRKMMCLFRTKYPQPLQSLLPATVLEKLGKQIFNLICQFFESSRRRNMFRADFLQVRDRARDFGLLFVFLQDLSARHLVSAGFFSALPEVLPSRILFGSEAFRRAK